MLGITTTSSSLVFILTINVIYRGASVKIVDVTEKCQKECGQSLLMQTGDVFDVHNCNDTCKRSLCSIGCEHWQEAIKDDNCKDVCNNNPEQKVDNTIKETSCVLGCGLAARFYLQDVKDEVGIPPAPVLVADSQTNTSIRVRWEGANSSSIPLIVTYQLQWKYDSLSGGWEYYQPKVPLTSTVQQIDDLLPYTKLKFRVAWIILPQHEPLISSESVVISTLASGAPSSTPIITSVTNVDSTRISVMWEPPLFSNGPIVSYVVHLHQLPNGFTLIKDIPEPNAERFFIFSNLKPNTTYSVAVSCRNNVGEGPKAVRNITTQVKPKESRTPEPFLIIGARQNIYKQALDDMFNEPEILYHPSNDSISVIGVAIHVKKELIFLSDSKGVIHRVQMYKASAEAPFDTVITPDSLCNSPGLLSVDWLNDKLYVTEGNQISRCDLGGQNYEIVVTGLAKTPTDMKVDPYNGFLYWVVAGSSKGGLYQVDLMNLEHRHGQSLNQANARLLLWDNHLVTFAVDHRNFRVFLPNETENTIYAVFLNRLEAVDIRRNTQKPQFRGVKSIAVFQDIFYFTTGDEVFCEEYHMADDKYYHNSFAYSSAEKPFVGLNMFHPDSQPVPVPVNPIENLEAVFEETVAKLHWLPPTPLGGLGRGAWQKWKYEISISEPVRNATILHLNITETSHTLENLHVNTEYWIRVRAYSSGGKGPWSECFKGQTLKAASQLGFPLILWSSKDGLLKSDMIGENVELMHQATFSDFRITDIAWYEDLLFLNTNTSRVYVYNTSRPSLSARVLPEITSSVSIAVDWLGKKLYWSNPNQQMISRSNLDGSQIEALLFLTIAKELNIDSVNGFIYWTTTHSVECARLNGNDRHTYFQTKFFYGKRVMGLTLDMDHHKVYWMVWSYDVVHLYHAPMALYSDSILEKHGNGKLVMSNWTINMEELSSLPEDTMQGPLRYYSNRLYWLHDQSRALISDVFGKNTAHVHALKFNDLKTFTVVDPILHPHPADFSRDTISVVPIHINDSTINVSGVWNNFNITWMPVTSVNYGKVFYEIGINDQLSVCTVVLEHPYYVYRSAASLPPYSPFTISIRVFTYWGSSRRIIKALRSPMSAPSEPLHPRVYVTHERSPFLISLQPNITAEFRWLPPKNPNGIILGYVVTFWKADENDQYNIDNLREEITITAPNKTVYLLWSLAVNTTYYFQVRAFTSIGEGPNSDVVEANTNFEVPVPKLLVAKGDALKMADFDLHDEQSLGKELLRPVVIDYLWEDGLIFWLDEDDTLMQSNFDGTNRSKLRELSASGNSLSIDWLGRQIYWSEGDDISAIWKLDLSGNIEPKRVIQCSNKIRSLKVEPFSSTLLWTSEFRDGLRCLMSCNTDGTHIRPLIPNIRRCLNSASEISSKMLSSHNDKRMKREVNTDAIDEVNNEDSPFILEHYGNDYRDVFFNMSNEPYFLADQSLTSCTCPRYPIIGPAISLDVTNISLPELLWVDTRKGNLWKSDLQGCHCQLLVNSSHTGDNNGLPPTSIAVDKMHIYWSNVTTGRIYSMSKIPLYITIDDASHSGRTIASDAIVSEKVPGVRDIKALGSHLQPYPDMKCLAHFSYEEPPQIFDVSSATITLCLKPVQQLAECGRISFASVAYTVYYSYFTMSEVSASSSNHNSCSGHFPWHKFANISQDVCATLVTFNTTVTLTGLQPYTEYAIRVSASNFYNTLPVTPGPIITGRTTEGVPSKPLNVQVTVLTPEEAEVTWDAPQFIYGPSVKFSVHWKGLVPGNDRQTFNDISRLEFEAKTSLSHYLSSFTELRAGQNYSVVVRAYPSNGSAYNASDRVFVQMFKNPDDPKLQFINSTAVIFLWKSPSDASVILHSLLWAESSSNMSSETSPEITKPDNNYEFNIFDLHPNTRYVFKLKLVYNSSKPTAYIRSFGEYRTKGERPSPPGSPEVLRVQHDTFKVIWKAADNRGGERMLYVLEVCSHDVDVPSQQISGWSQVYNGSETKWVIANLDPNDRFAFRVYAINEFGTGNYSEESPAISLSQIPLTESQEEQLAIVLGSILSIVCLVVVLGLCTFLKIYKRRENDKKILQMTHNLHTPDLELATLRELPQHHSFVHQNNAIYSLGDVIGEVELGGLPRISRDQIILIKFLGSGAFGEVFEGLARNLPGEDNEEATPVAIKTLRKGATDQEKAEFLKEAQLMSNFKHEHILRLLGVCLNNDPNFIILELMEGGDLLSYLRSNRPTVFSQSAVLSVQDLISICVDVAKGCRYLEEMHFVHRDLAARNCLVSSSDFAHRVVKIGDFGLARDIYKNDYYRKEGEGLLPVRWMSPESLVDGVFTSQSDVWAFGVLLWEIMTLGQQPYPARTNVEVLHYVRGGGRLDKPDNCPDDLHQLMLRCWSYNSIERPTFKYCLDQLQELKRKSADLPLTTVHNRNYLGRQDGGIVNLAYNADEASPSSPGDRNNSTREKANLSLLRTTRLNSEDTAEEDSCFSRQGGGGRTLSEISTDDKTDLLEATTPTEAHKYLELLYDSDVPPIYDSDGYEIPLSMSESQGPHPMPANCGTVPNFLKEDFNGDSAGNVHGSDNVDLMCTKSTISNLSGGSMPPPIVGECYDVDSNSDDAKRFIANASLSRQVEPLSKCTASQPLLTRSHAEDLSRSRAGSVASAGDADCRSCHVFGDCGGDGNINIRKTISDSVPLLENGKYSSASHSALTLRLPSMNGKKRPASNGGIPSGGLAHCQNSSWKDSSLSLGSSDASYCSSPVSPSYRSSNVSGMSALSALSGLSSSDTASSSTSGIEVDTIPVTSWC